VSIIPPVTIGVKLNVPVAVEPKETWQFTSISGYLKVCNPVP